MALKLESNDRFPDAEMIGRLWDLDGVEVVPLRMHHGAQVILRTPGEPDWLLKHCRAEGVDRLRLEAILAALETTRSRLDPCFIPQLRPMTNGHRVLRHDKKLFYVMQRVDGRRPSFRREGDVLPVVEALGKLHAHSTKAAKRLAREFHEPMTQSVDSVWRGQIEWFEWLSSKLSRRTEKLTAAGRLFAERHAAFEELVIEADAYLRTELGDIFAAKCPLVLAHGDSYENNYMLSKSEDAPPWMLDLESVGLRPAPTDLIVPLATFGITHRWSPDRLKKILEVYEKERPLPPVERVLLRAMLIFPRQWTRSMHCLVRRRKEARVDWGTMRNLTTCLLKLPAQKRLLEEIKKGW